jgi:hypothetical protein
MNSSMRQFGIAVTCGIAATFGAGVAHAQVNPYAAFYQQQLAQQMWNTQAMQGSVYGRPTVPGYISTLPAVDGIVGSPISPGTTPGYGFPGTPNVTDPYSSSYNPYNPYNSYYNSSGFGPVLQGSADVMRAYGSVVTAQEQARLLREQYNQAKLETRKKQFDLEMYIRANTPTYTQEQEAIARNTLRRIQTNSLPGEISNGKAINYLLDDLRKHSTKKLSLEPILMSEGVLANLNVTKNTFGLGVLRDGRVNWPTALEELLGVEQRKRLNSQIKELVNQATKDRPDASTLKEVRSDIEKLRNDLVSKVNEVPTAQYLEAKRFLREFDDATTALERGEAGVQARFNRFVENGKSVQEVVEYLVQNGLRVAPATAADEAAYRALHSALATYNIAMNSQTAAPQKEQ